MGEKDIDKLFRIHRYIHVLNKENSWYFNFKVDLGSFETRIDVNDNGDVFLGNGKLPLIGFDMQCPDLLDWNDKIIIEFEEEAKKSTGYFGAKKHKGHSDYTNTKDTKRDNHYKKFVLLKIWESDMKSDLWKRKIQSCLNLQRLYPLYKNTKC